METELPKQATGASRTQAVRGESEWRRWFDLHSTSGLSQPAFCRRHGLALSTFTAWRRRLFKGQVRKTQGSRKAAVLPAPAGFIAVTPGAPASSRPASVQAGEAIEICVDGLQMRLGGEAGARVMAALLRRLEPSR